MTSKFITFTWSHWTLGGVSIIFLYATSRLVYNLFLSPLAKIPGPKRAAISNAWYCYHWVHGTYPEDVRQLHLKYGPVVRIAPNEVSFSTPQSFNDIYGHVTKDHALFIKSTFYEFPQPEAGIVAERKTEKHREARKLLSHGFSLRALKDQETILHEKVNLLISQISKIGDNGLLTLNIKTWYNWLSFDVIGELAFGEAFGALLAAKSHFWIETIHEAAAMVGWFEIGRRLPFMWPIIFFLLPAGMKEKFDVFLKHSRVQVRKRVAAQASITRTDFFSTLLSSKAKERENEEWLLAQANVLVIAGSDTTATALTAITYYLCKYPDKLAILQREIREAFTDRSKITGDEVTRLPYLNAVIEEGLRLFPPTPFGLPRISPGATVDGIWIPKGVVVSTSSWTTTHNDAYFHRAAEFFPERWMAHENKSSQGDELNAAKPFSLGPRGCLGINLAYLEMRLTIANLVYAFDWALTDKEFDFEKAAKFEGFWLVPDLKVKFTPVGAKI